MKRKFFLNIIFLIFSIFLFAEEINFSVITTGNYIGEYKSLSRIYTVMEELKLKRGEFIKINTGNNLIGEKEKDDIFFAFFNDLKFDFNFYGLGEYLLEAEEIYNFQFSSINITDKKILPYKIIKRENSTTAILGITNIYDYENGIDYFEKLKKMIYFLEEKVDFIFIVSDLTRAENVKILRRYGEIAALFESGKMEMKEEPVKIGESYILSSNKFQILDIRYSSKRLKKINEYNEKYQLKHILIDNINIIDEYKNYDKNKIVEDYIEKKEAEIRDSQQEILGYNLKTFYKEEILFADEIILLDQIGEKILKKNRADLLILPARNIKKGLKKGFYNRKEFNELFTNDKLVVANIKKIELDKLEKIRRENRGTRDYLYLLGKVKILDKNEYKVMVLENALELYSIKCKKEKTMKKTMKNFE